MTDKRYRWHCIYDRIKDIPNPIGAEIGVFRGECSGHLLEMHPGLKLYMIDMWSPDTYKGKGDDAATEPYRRLYEKECDDNFKKACAVADKYKMSADILKGSSLDAAKWFDDEMLDFVFIDGSHDYESVKADIIAWRGKIKPGGWLIMHDYDNPSFPGVRQAVDEMFSCDVSGWDLPFNISRISRIELDSDYIAAVRV
jgi:hypothetical protein